MRLIPTQTPDLHSSISGKRLTIGYLTGSLNDAYQNTLFHTVLDVVRERDVNLITFLTTQAWVGPKESQTRNSLLELIGHHKIDGLVIENAWANYDRLIFDLLQPLPMTCLSIEAEGIPSVVAEYQNGIRELLTHLVDAHRYRKIAFIHAPHGEIAQRDEQARFGGYQEVLSRRQITFDPQLVVRSAGWDLPATRESIRVLLDERQMRPDAIVACNDLLARWAMEALQERGIRVPQDIAVVGYDNISAYQFLSPPLTTVHQPIAEKARLATEMLLARLAGETIPERTVLPTRLVVRRSCGCQRPTTEHPALQNPTEQTTFPSTSAPQAGALFDAFFAELDGKKTGNFTSLLEETLNASARSGSRAGIWQDIVTALRQSAAKLEMPARSQAEEMLNQAQAMVDEATEQWLMRQWLRMENQMQITGLLSGALISALRSEKLSDVLAQWLPLLGIERCFVAQFENPDQPAGWARWIVAYDQHQATTLEPNQRFRAPELIPASLIPHSRRFNMVVVPVRFPSEQVGYATFEMGPREGMVYELLGGLISNILKGAQLYDASMQARAAAEKANQLKTRLLANVTHELRTPLHIILHHAQAAQDALANPLPTTVEELQKHLSNMRQSAEHQLRVINDLLDLSRAEIDALDMEITSIEPRSLLESTFQALAESAARPGVTWRLAMPERLPHIQADPVRIRQVTLNLLSNAAKYTEKGEIELGAETSGAQLHLWVRDTGTGIPPDQQDRIFEPFNTISQPHRQPGIGLGLSITRRLVALHQGQMRLESTPGQGSTFHIYLPCTPEQPFALENDRARLVLLFVSESSLPDEEMIRLSQQQGIEILPIKNIEEVESLANEIQPVGLVWDLLGARPDSTSWKLIQQIRKFPRLSRLPLTLSGQAAIPDAAVATGMVSVVIGKTLADATANLHPSAGSGPILIVEDDPEIRAQHELFINKELGGYPVRTAEDGAIAIEMMLELLPSLVVLDLNMPRINGFEVLDWMRATPATRHIPVLILTNRALNQADIERLEHHARVNIQSKGILNDQEAGELLNQILSEGVALPAYTSALVKRTVAFFQQDYHRLLSRKEVAQAIGLSENYLSQIFRQELGITPWEYLNRYRIKIAKELLLQTEESVSMIATRIGFEDPSYFGRVFRKVTGLSPSEYREQKKLPS